MINTHYCYYSIDRKNPNGERFVTINYSKTLKINKFKETFIFIILAFNLKVIARPELNIAVISRQARKAVDRDSIDPSVELVSGLLRSFNHEYPLTACQWLDLDRSEVSAKQIVQILEAEPAETEIALRSANLFAPRLHAAQPEPYQQDTAGRLSTDGRLRRIGLANSAMACRKQRNSNWPILKGKELKSLMLKPM